MVRLQAGGVRPVPEVPGVVQERAGDVVLLEKAREGDVLADLECRAVGRGTDADPYPAIIPDLHKELPLGFKPPLVTDGQYHGIDALFLICPIYLDSCGVEPYLDPAVPVCIMLPPPGIIQVVSVRIGAIRGAEIDRHVGMEVRMGHRHDVADYRRAVLVRDCDMNGCGDVVEVGVNNPQSDRVISRFRIFVGDVDKRAG